MPPLFLLLLTLLTTTTTTTTTAAAAATTTLISDLTHLQSQSPNGVIHLTDHLLGQILALPHPRPFSLLIFFDAVHLHDKHELQLPSLKSEFSIVSKSYVTNDVTGSHPCFFFDVEFKESQRSFSLFAVNTLPHVRFVGPHVTNLKDSDQIDQGDFPRLAEALVEFLGSKGVHVGELHRPPLFSRVQVAIFLVILMILAPFAVRKVVRGETLLHDYKFWLFMSVFVYFFSVSGTMHNIIRKMPMFIADRHDPNKLVFFYQGSGAQLGAEGFAIGFLYTIVGLLLGFVTHGCVKIRNLTVQRVATLVSLVVSFWAVKKVIYLDNWKTGYGVHAYW